MYIYITHMHIHAHTHIYIYIILTIHICHICHYLVVMHKHPYGSKVPPPQPMAEVVCVFAGAGAAAVSALWGSWTSREVKILRKIGQNESKQENLEKLGKSCGILRI